MRKPDFPPAETATPAWHAMPVDDALARHDVDASSGLTEEQAAARLRRHGPNQLREHPGRSALARFLSQLNGSTAPSSSVS
jgi:magnesium-transporting ATPase (P-type)